MPTPDIPRVSALDGLDSRYQRISIDGNLPEQGLILNVPLSQTGIHIIPSLAYPLSPDIVGKKSIEIPPRAPKLEYEPANRCIYCGCTVYGSPTRTDLGEEHIIPGGLGADMIIPHASCLKCERMTSRIETRLMHNLFDPTRKRLDIRNRNRKPLLKNRFVLSHPVDGKDVQLRLPIEEHPTVLFLPKLGPPGLLTGRPKFLHGIQGAWLINLNANPNVLTKHAIKALCTPGVDTVLFTQLLAKIAHSLAVAEVLLDNFDPLLLDFISREHQRTENDDRRYHLVGGDGGDYPPYQYLHEVGLGLHETRGTTHLVARVRLFAFMGAPVYYVVVGIVPPSKRQAVIARLSSNNSRMQVL